MQWEDDMQTSALIAILILLALIGCVSAPQPEPVARTFQSDLTAAQQKETIPPMMFPAHANALPPTPPGMIITTSANVATPAPRVATVQAIVIPAPNTTLGWDAEGADVDGYVLYSATGANGYTMRIVVTGATNNTQRVYEAPTLFYRWAATAFVDLPGDPIVTCHTNRTGVYCVTNTLIESGLSPEISDYSSNLVPFITLTAFNAVLMGYGTSNRTYSVTAGASLDALTPIASFQGSNALYSIVDTLASGSRFYKVISK